MLSNDIGLVDKTNLQLFFQVDFHNNLIYIIYLWQTNYITVSIYIYIYIYHAERKFNEIYIYKTVHCKFTAYNSCVATW